MCCDRLLPPCSMPRLLPWIRAWTALRRRSPGFWLKASSGWRHTGLHRTARLSLRRQSRSVLTKCAVILVLAALLPWWSDNCAVQSCRTVTDPSYESQNEQARTYIGSLRQAFLFSAVSCLQINETEELQAQAQHTDRWRSEGLGKQWVTMSFESIESAANTCCCKDSLSRTGYHSGSQPTLKHQRPCCHRGWQARGCGHPLLAQRHAAALPREAGALHLVTALAVAPADAAAVLLQTPASVARLPAHPMTT